MASIALAVWALAVAVWAVRPQTDWVPVGVDYTQAPPRPVSAEVGCNSLFDARPRDPGPLPELTPQPATAPALAFQREPCELVHGNARLVLGIDIAFVGLAAGAAAALMAYRKRIAQRSLVAPLPMG